MERIELTKREREVLRLTVEECLPMRVVAERLGVGLKTIKFHRYRIRKKLADTLEPGISVHALLCWYWWNKEKA